MEGGSLKQGLNVVFVTVFSAVFNIVCVNTVALVDALNTPNITCDVGPVVVQLTNRYTVIL